MRVLYNYHNLRTRRKGASGVEVDPRLGGFVDCELLHTPSKNIELD